MAFQLDSGWAALLGAAIGGLATFGAPLLIEWRKDRRQRAALALAICGEASAVSTLVRRRKYLDTIVQCAFAAKAGDVRRLMIRLPKETIPVFRSAAKDIGSLDGTLLPLLVPKLVVVVDGVAADLGNLLEYPVGYEGSLLGTGDQSVAWSVYAELLAMVMDLLETCDAVVEEVKRLYPAEAHGFVICRSPIEITVDAAEGLPISCNS
jgi:hypothetical protein